MVFAAAQGVYSLRSISEQCRVNIEYMWLLEGYLAPSHMTFGRFFHRIPIAVLRQLFVQFVHQLSLLDSVDFTEWYIDGTKMEVIMRTGYRRLSTIIPYDEVKRLRRKTEWGCNIIAFIEKMDSVI